MLKVGIDPHSGFCGGVVRAITTAEKCLEEGKRLYSLGEIVHNEEELGRLSKKGLVPVLSLEDIPAGSKVLIRAHGVPPSVYDEARSRGLDILDCTCPVVLRIQKMIREASGRILIFGKHGHPEVQGLVGQTDRAVVFQNLDQLRELIPGLDRDESYEVFSQTTMSPVDYALACGILKEALPDITVHETICLQVASRHRELSEFAKANDVVIFVSGIHSSNGRVLGEFCRSVNPRTYRVGGPDDLDPSWFKPGDKVGVSGATSTPKWLLEQVARATENLH